MRFSAVALALFLAAAALAQAPNKPNSRIEKEVRHHLLSLPYFNVFDNLEYKVEGDRVTLLGAVTRPSLKPDAENTVKEIEGVESVNNQIEVLPPSPMDDQLRRALFLSIYGYPALERYALGVVKPIHIVVKNGNVALEGVVDTESDKDLVTMRAKGVSGVFNVTNNLKVGK